MCDQIPNTLVVSVRISSKNELMVQSNDNYLNLEETFVSEFFNNRILLK